MGHRLGRFPYFSELNHMDISQKPLPRMTPDTEPFWQGCQRHELLLTKCNTCNKVHLPPGPVCPFCFSTKVDFLKASGLAKVYAFTLFYKGSPPYISAWVMLNEGVALLSNIIECDSEKLKIGTTLQAVFHSVSGGQKVPVFVPFSENSFENSEA